MLEEKIDKLTKTIEKLIATFEASKTAKTVKTEPTETNTKETNTKETNTKETTTAGIDEKALQDLCLSKVRTKKSNRNVIKDILKKFGGELIKDIDPSKYNDLKSELEAI